MSTAPGRPLLAARGSPGEFARDGGSSTNTSHSSGSNRPPSGPPSGSSPSGHHHSRPKRTLIESACQACRRRKSKCDGQRPSCSRCLSLRSDCIYEAEEGESRWSALKRRNQQLEVDREDIREVLEWVRTAPEAEAALIFERIRSTTHSDICGLLIAMRQEGFRGTIAAAATASVSVTTTAAVTILPNSQGFPPNDPSQQQQQQPQRLPPINSILAANPAPAPPVRPTIASLTQHSSRSSEESQSPGPGSAAHKRAPLETLEPSLQMKYRPPPSLSSEESSGSMGYGGMPLPPSRQFSTLSAAGGPQPMLVDEHSPAAAAPFMNHAAYSGPPSEDGMRRGGGGGYANHRPGGM